MKYKVCVYAISKNESKFVDKWVDSMSEADKIFVLDTGSTDNTVELLTKRGVIVNEKIIDPWRFDVARNISLEMVDKDTDICVCTDLDEVFNKGWRNELEKKWNKNITRADYIYNWSHDELGRPNITFYREKIHTRNHFKWIYPVHEVLECDKKENVVTIDSIILDHYPDNTKSRSSYLSLLELSYEENPTNDRTLHYLGREYMYYGYYDKCIDTLIKHLQIGTWKDERCASMRFIGRCYMHLKRYKESEMWFKEAIKEAPYLRDPYLELAFLYYDLEKYDSVIYYIKKAQKIKKRNKVYINEPFSYDETIYDLYGLSLYYKNKKNKALKYIEKALKINPNNERIKNNRKIILNELGKI